MNSYRLRLLLLKELKFYRRESNALFGIFVFNALLTIMICALLRNLKISPEEISLIVCPYLWLILILSIFRITIQNINEESKKGLFLKQIRDGYLSLEIFISKLISGLTTGALLIVVQTFFFSWLIGFEEIIRPIISVSFIYFISLPALISLAFIGAYISLRSASEEVLMPILLLPMILILSIAAVTVAEDIFNTKYLDFQFYWLKLIIGMQVIFVIVCEFLFRVISKLKI